jgi:ribose transport system substrate-binding protein
MKTSFRFVIVPKVSHPWFDEVVKGARDQARFLQERLGADVVVDYRPPGSASVAEQNTVLEGALSPRPDGIALDPVDAVANIRAVERIRSAGIPLLLFDAPSGASGIPSVGNDFARQGAIAAEHLAELLAGRGKVALMRGVPSAPNHDERYRAQLSVLKRHPGIVVIDGGTDNDDIETARQQAAAVLASNPDLSGYLCCDAAGPIGIAAAVRQARRVGTVKVVGMDGIRPILDAIREGVIQASSSTKPRMQGSMAILMLWQAASGVPIPNGIDTGIDVITAENVAAFLEEAAEPSGALTH